jgi:hypothetical protein
MGGKSDDTQTVTQKQELPPQINSLLSLLTGEISGLAGASRPDYLNGYSSPYGAGGAYAFPGSGMFSGGGMNPGVQNGPSMAPGFSGPLPSLVPELSPDTMQGLDLLRSQFSGGPGMDLVNDTVSGDYLRSNPFSNPSRTSRNMFRAGQNNVTGINQTAGAMNWDAGQKNWSADQANPYGDVADAIRRQANIAVGDRFSQAGRGGSQAEYEGIAGEVADRLAPIAFGARESQLNRQTGAEENRINRMTGATENRIGRIFGSNNDMINRAYNAQENRLGRQFSSEESYLQRLQDLNRLGFSGYEAERARQQGMLPQLFGMQGQDAQNYLNAGSVIEDYQRNRALEPYQRLNLLSGPIGTAISGAPVTTTQTQPLNRNGLAAGLGGALGGAQLGSMFTKAGATVNPLWGLGGGLLGLFS